MLKDRADRLSDPARLQALRAFEKGALAADREIQDLTGAARYAFNAAISAVSLVKPDFVQLAGLAGFSEIAVPTDIAFCTRVVRSGEPFFVKNLGVHPEFATNRYVLQPPYTRFYAGVPLRCRQGFIVGTFAILDTTPRFRFGDEDLVALRRFAGLASSLVACHMGGC